MSTAQNESDNKEEINNDHPVFAAIKACNDDIEKVRYMEFAI
jgi:hypothetical protein